VLPLALMLARLEKHMTELSRGWPAFLMHAVQTFRIDVVRETLMSVTKGDLEIGRQSFGYGDPLRIADQDNSYIRGHDTDCSNFSGLASTLSAVLGPGA
jgi:hypothetical protein